VSIAGASGVVVDAVISGRLDAVVSDEIEAEYLALPTKPDIVRLLARRDMGPERLQDLLRAFCALADRVTPAGEAPPCRDENDRKYLHCAVTARASYLFGSVDGRWTLAKGDEIPVEEVCD
jgi:predicted nucleic acid-binding protein